MVGFGDEAGEFADHVGVLGEGAEIFAPGGDFFGGHFRLGEVIEDEPLPRMALHEGGGGAQVGAGGARKIAGKVVVVQEGRVLRSKAEARENWFSVSC